MEPIDEFVSECDHYVFPLDLGDDIIYPGLSRLEYFTALAMQGCCAGNSASTYNAKVLAERALKIAVQTLYALNQTNETTIREIIGKPKPDYDSANDEAS